MAVRDKHSIATLTENRKDPPNHPRGPDSDVLGLLTARNRSCPNRPTRVLELLTNLRRGDALPIPVVPLQEVIDDGIGCEPRQLGSTPRSLQR